MKLLMRLDWSHAFIFPAALADERAVSFIDAHAEDEPGHAVDLLAPGHGGVG